MLLCKLYSDRNVTFREIKFNLVSDAFSCLCRSGKGILLNDDAVSYYSALIWQKEASDKSDISRKRAKCVCHLHWRQWNIMMSYRTYLLVGWVFLHEIWPGRRAHYVNYENINNSNLDGMSLASFCQSRAVLLRCLTMQMSSVPINTIQKYHLLWHENDMSLRRSWDNKKGSFRMAFSF